MKNTLTSKQLEEMYEKAKAGVVGAKPPNITLKATILRCFQLASKPGTPDLPNNVIEMISHGARMWVEHQIKYEQLQTQMKDIEVMLSVHRLNEELDLQVNLLKKENTKLTKLVTPKADKP